MERILTKIEIKKILEERNSVQKVQFKKKNDHSANNFHQ